MFMGERQAMKNRFTEVLVLLRGVNDWSKSEVARRAGISVSLYSRYEHGLVEPTLSNLLKIADAYGVDLETLVGRRSLKVVPSDVNQGKAG